jgi:hypothetical protein
MTLVAPAAVRPPDAAVRNPAAIGRHSAAAARLVEHAVAGQRADAASASLPDARVFESALMGFVLERVRVARAARRWSGRARGWRVRG